jgi:hypothetical protein
LIATGHVGRYALRPDLDLAQLVHTEQHRLLLEESGVGHSRPDAVIEFARPRGDPEVLALTSRRPATISPAGAGAMPPPEEVAADWYHHVHLPGLVAVYRAGLPAACRSNTEADLFLWVHERPRDLPVFDRDAYFDRAAAYAAREGLGRRDRRVIEHKKTNQLSPRPQPGSSPS